MLINFKIQSDIIDKELLAEQLVEESLSCSVPRLTVHCI